MSKAYEIGSDDLVLDGQNIDVKNIKISVSGKGTIKRGQIIDRNVVKDGESTAITYVEHKTEGESNAIAAEDVNYDEEDTTVVVPCYITGEFRESAVVTSKELTDADKEALRIAGIILA